jgi:response regulator NasT
MYRTLTHEGHHVIAIAENGRQLIDECINQRPDLIITDIEMPELDGLAALHEICMTNPVPAIIVSANSDQEMLVRASRELVFAYLVKPIKMDDLQPAIWLTMQRYSEVAVLRQRLIGLD